MNDAVHAMTSPLTAVGLVTLVMTVGVYATAVLDEAIGARVAGDGIGWASPFARPARRAAVLWQQRPAPTERPDALLWVLAPGLCAGVAALALAVVPLGDGLAVADVRTGIVVFGAAEVLVLVAVHLHGWSANSLLSLIGGYRYVAIVLSSLLISMFVLIAAALPARSLSIGRIVAAQEGLWNVLAQPLGLPLWIVVASATAFWGPLDVPDATELAGGTTAETSGPQRLAWAVARRSLLVAYAVAGAAVFLGGHHGPLLPGPVWMMLKSLTVLTLVVFFGQVVGRMRTQRFVSVAWTVLLPLSFLHLAQSGILALLRRGS